MEMNIDEFKKKFPNLAKELLEGEGEGLTIHINRPKARLDDPWHGYLPGPIDYIRRCKTVEEALEVINYLEKHGEIDSSEAEHYRDLLKKHGLEYFGPRKTDDYYYKKAYEYWRKKALNLRGENEK
jgi:hypothetical protein